MKKVTNNILYKEIKDVLENARQSAYRAVNFAMVVAYWQVGKIIVEHEQRGKDKAAYGTALLKELSKQLTADFGKGFTETNLKYFRKFYLSFPPPHKSHALSDQSLKSEIQKSHALRAELSWTHYRLLLKVEKEKKSEPQMAMIK